MKSQAFSTKEVILFGWNTFKKNFSFFIGVLVAAWVISSLPNFVGELVAEEGSLLWTILIVLGIILSFLVQIGLLRITIKFAKNEKPVFSDLWADAKLFFPFLGGTILYSLIVLGGLILLIVPGVIWAIKYYYFGYFIVDKKVGPLEALRQSAKATDGHKSQLFFLIIILSLINLLGAIPFGLGLFITVPIILVALSLVYIKLSSEPLTQPEPAASVGGEPASTEEGPKVISKEESDEKNK